MGGRSGEKGTRWTSGIRLGIWQIKGIGRISAENKIIHISVHVHVKYRRLSTVKLHSNRSIRFNRVYQGARPRSVQRRWGDGFSFMSHDPSQKSTPSRLHSDASQPHPSIFLDPMEGPCEHGRRLPCRSARKGTNRTKVRSCRCC
jgi:hypothetical protein